VFTCQPPYGTYRGTTVDTTQGTGTAVTSADAGTAKGSTTPPTPVAPSANGGPSTGQTAATTAGGGCSLTAGDLSSDPAWLLGLLALVGLFIARRSRKG
jgi:MYXO-CTERM domain-containing protein